jgi:hypothetical protein
MITEIYKEYYWQNEYQYIGKMRNQDRFDINDNIFFRHNDNTICRGIIVGVELIPKENPEYIYKVKIPAQIIVKDEIKKDQYVNVSCGPLFKSLEDAKQRVLKDFKNRIKIESENIENYFNQFKKLKK